MRLMISASMAALLALSVAPALAADAEEASAGPIAEEMALERLEAPEAGLAMSFPAGWRVSQPEGIRESPITTAEGGPIYATTAVLANGGGAWCDVDIYLDMTATLDEHAYAYASYLRQINGADAPMVVVETELPAGSAFRIEVFDPAEGRLRSMHLVDGPVTDDGTFDRYLLTCAAPGDSEPFWEAIAASVELSVPTAAEDEEAQEAGAAA
jgi:hypothetical protein